MNVGMGYLLSTEEEPGGTPWFAATCNLDLGLTFAQSIHIGSDVHLWAM